MSSQEKEKSISLLGDLLIHDHVGRNSDKIINILRKANIVLGNLEIPLATRGYPSAKSLTLRANQSVLEDFRKMNVKALSLANNHMMDFGFEGMLETMEILDTHNLAHVGAGRNLTEALKPAILRLGDLRVAFLACSSHVFANSIATEDRMGMAPLRVSVHIIMSAKSQQEYVGRYPIIITKVDEGDLNSLLMAVENAKKEADFMVVSIHWGLAWQPMVLDYQTEVAHTLINHGADIIMGHGPHVLQGIEMYKKRYIFYSLGHFVFQQSEMIQALAKLPKTDLPSQTLRRVMVDPVKWRKNETAIGKVMLSRSEIMRAEVMPVMLDGNGNPQVCDNESAISILNYLAVFSRYLGTSIKIKENKGIIES